MDVDLGALLPKSMLIVKLEEQRQSLKKYKCSKDVIPKIEDIEHFPRQLTVYLAPLFAIFKETVGEQVP
jgi:hypothetical protein